MMSHFGDSGLNENRALAAYRPYGVGAPCARQHSQGPV